MKTKTLWAVLPLMLLCFTASAKTSLQRQQVMEVMARVADWQIQNFDTPLRLTTQDNRSEADLDWTCGALYIGMYDWAELSQQTTGTTKYFDWLKSIGDRNKWHVGSNVYHADHICVAQTWLRMAARYKDGQMAGPSLERAKQVLENPATQYGLNYDWRTNPGTTKRWCWCDALFMAPPVYLQVYNRTGDKRYLDFMKSEYKALTRILFDPTDHLYYRDSRYIGMQEKNGKPVYWGRGNGWVIAGLANMLKVYPRKSDPEGYKYFKDIFVKLANSLAALQQPDGYWHASLLDPASYPSPETSSTGFITYGLAYGVSAGLLSKSKVMPAVEKGWDALCRAVDADGKLGWVQPVGADPQKVTRDNTAVYGIGALLSAGSEICKMLK